MPSSPLGFLAISRWGSVERRLDGRTLVGDGGARRVIVYDDRGKLERIEQLPRGCVDYETILRI